MNYEKVRTELNRKVELTKPTLNGWGMRLIMMTFMILTAIMMIMILAGHTIFFKREIYLFSST